MKNILTLKEIIARQMGDKTFETGVVSLLRNKVNFLVLDTASLNNVKVLKGIAERNGKEIGPSITAGALKDRIASGLIDIQLLTLSFLADNYSDKEIEELLNARVETILSKNKI